MMTCAVLGQAVGEAAAIATEYNTTPQGVYDFYLEELQQRLMRADCFIPYLVRKAVTQKGTISGCENAENLRNGLDRNHSVYGSQENGVFAELGQAITYTFAEPTYVECAHIVFDSDLNRRTLPGDDAETYHSMRANIMPDSPKMHVPDTLVKEYILEIKLSDGSIRRENVTHNIKRMNEIVVDAPVLAISLIPQKLWGGQARVHIFSFDLY